MTATRSASACALTALLGGVVVIGALATVSVAQAAPASKSDKVRICHRTNSLTNPYVSIEVARSSVDGDGGNDTGQGDHFLNHTGTIWSSSSTKAEGWGDIIPSIDGVHGGLNWTAEGKALWTAGCRPSAVSDEDADGVPDAVDPDESTTTDTDGDGFPDAVDSDDDGDGITDNAECDAKLSATEPSPDATPSTSATAESTTATAESTSTPGSNAATGVGQTTNGAGAPRALCSEDGTVPPKDESTADTDGDGTPNASDRDDDNDGIPDSRDRDEDGDGNPDVTDPDDDGDGTPDPLDRDNPAVEPLTVVDTDGDGTPDARDRDDDGDGVVDARDKDADGDGRPDVTPQPLAEATVLPARIDAGESTVLFRGEPMTVAGVPAVATIACTPDLRASAMRASAMRMSSTTPMGDLGAEAVTRMLCAIDKGGKATRIIVAGSMPTTVTVVFTASAVGPYRALRDVRTYRVAR